MSWVKGVPLQSGVMFVSDSVPTGITVMFFSDYLHIASQLLSWHTFFLRERRKYFFLLQGKTDFLLQGETDFLLRGEQTSYFRVKQTSLICVSAVWGVFFLAQVLSKNSVLGKS